MSEFRALLVFVCSGSPANESQLQRLLDLLLIDECDAGYRVSGATSLDELVKATQSIVHALKPPAKQRQKRPKSVGDASSDAAGEAAMSEIDDLGKSQTKAQGPVLSKEYISSSDLEQDPPIATPQHDFLGFCPLGGMPAVTGDNLDAVMQDCEAGVREAIDVEQAHRRRSSGTPRIVQKIKKLRAADFLDRDGGAALNSSYVSDVENETAGPAGRASSCEPSVPSNVRGKPDTNSNSDSDTNSEYAIARKRKALMKLAHRSRKLGRAHLADRSNLGSSGDSSVESPDGSERATPPRAYETEPTSKNSSTMAEASSRTTALLDPSEDAPSRAKPRRVVLDDDSDA